MNEPTIGNHYEVTTRHVFSGTLENIVRDDAGRAYYHVRVGPSTGIRENGLRVVAAAAVELREVEG